MTLTVEDNKCIVCEYIMSYLDQALGNKTTEAEIREALDQVCIFRNPLNFFYFTYKRAIFQASARDPKRLATPMTPWLQIV